MNSAYVKCKIMYAIIYDGQHFDSISLRLKMSQKNSLKLFVSCWGHRKKLKKAIHDMYSGIHLWKICFKLFFVSNENNIAVAL